MTQTSAQRLEASLPYPLTYQSVLHLAQAYLDDPEQGDVTPANVYRWINGSDLTDAELEQLEPAIEQLRRRHFAALRQPVPRHPELIK
jgi:macrodomain Ter protein organizer (MatP/YcbG family)